MKVMMWDDLGKRGTTWDHLDFTGILKCQTHGPAPQDILPQNRFAFG